MSDDAGESEPAAPTWIQEGYDLSALVGLVATGGRVQLGAWMDGADAMAQFRCAFIDHRGRSIESRSDVSMEDAIATAAASLRQSP